MFKSFTVALNGLALSALALLSGCQTVGKVANAPLELYKDLSGYPYEAARDMVDPASTADEQRRGVNYLVAREWGQQEPYTDVYAEIANATIVPEPDFTVRAAAIRALNRSREAEATPVFIRALNAEDALVRLEAAKALANLPDDNAIEPLTQRLEGRVEKQNDTGRPTVEEESQDVRIAAADALRHYATLPVARSLVAQLKEPNFGVAWQSRRSLRHMTGKDFKYDESAWLSHLASSEKPFQ